jgi:two-component system, NtrC family, response regulator AlgB
VDDDAGVRQSLRLCLEAAGARVLGVATGGAALEALDRAAEAKAVRAGMSVL